MRRDEPPIPSHTTRAALAAAAIASVVPIALILSGVHRGRAAYDAVVYHERFARQLAESFPSIDLSNPLTATTPGYHTIMALVALVTDSTTSMRLTSALIGALCVAILAWTVARRVSALAAVVLTLPFACSMYVLSSSAHILPDNLGWTLVLAVLLVALRERVDTRALALGSVLLALLVFVRQVHLWAAAPLCVAAWISAAPSAPSPITITPPRVRAGVLASIACVPALAIVVSFAILWNGLTPPRFQGDMQALNTATPLFLLLELAILSAAFTPLVARLVLARLATNPVAVLAPALLTLAAALIVPSTHDPELGRSTGWWVLVEKTPDLGHTNLAILVLAPLGAAILAALCVSQPKGRGWVVLAAALAFAAAQSATLHSWSRYHEPFILLMLPILIATARDAHLPKRGLGTPTTLSALAVSGVLLLIAYQGLIATNHVEPQDPPTRHSTPDDPWVSGDQIPAPTATIP